MTHDSDSSATRRDDQLVVEAADSFHSFCSKLRILGIIVVELRAQAREVPRARHLLTHLSRCARAHTTRVVRHCTIETFLVTISRRRELQYRV